MNTLIRYPVPTTLPAGTLRRPVRFTPPPVAGGPTNLDSSSGTATAGGGDATVSIIGAPVAAYVTGPGRRAGVVQAVTSPPLPRQAVSVLLAGLAPSIGTTDVDASGGTASAVGGDATVSVEGVAVVAVVVGPGRRAGVVQAVTSPPLAAPRRVPALVAGLTPSTDFDASGGTAVAAGGDASVSVAVVGFPPGAVGSGRRLGVVRAALPATTPPPPPVVASRITAQAQETGGAELSAAAGTATANGGTLNLAFTLTAGAGTATAGGGTATATAGAGVSVTAENGTATASGGTLSLSYSYSAQAGTATAVGGTATAFSGTGLIIADGTATAGGGTSLFSARWTAAAGTATATGGTVGRVHLALTGTATASGGTLGLIWRYPAINGTATATGGAAVAFTPTLGVIDGSSAIVTGVDDGSSLSGLIDGSSVLTGVE